eukprot:UN09795
MFSSSICCSNLDKNRPQDHTKEFTWNKLQELGYDSVIYTGPTGDEVVVYSPKQILTNSIRSLDISRSMFDIYHNGFLFNFPDCYKTDGYIDMDFGLEKRLKCNLNICHDR